MVSVISLILFAGAELKIESNAGVYIASLENDWLTFTFRSLEVSKFLEKIVNSGTQFSQTDFLSPVSGCKNVTTYALRTFEIVGEENRKSAFEFH